MKKTIWKEYLKENNFQELTKDISTDVLIIGGGISGILLARQLKENNINYTLVEKDIIGSSTTSSTTAFLTIGHETLYHTLKKEQRTAYLYINSIAMHKYKQLSKRFNFDYEEVDSCLYSKDHELINREYQVLKELNQNVYINKDVPLDSESIGVTIKNQAIINPTKLINELSKDLNIYEHTKVIKLKKHYCVLENGHIIKFKYVVTCTHYPINNKLNFLFPRLIQRKSYVAVIKKEQIKGMYCSLDQDSLMYYRMYKDYLIIGIDNSNPKVKCINEFKKFLINELKFKEEQILYYWQDEDTITIDGIPYIGRSDIFHTNHLIVTGFNFWGFTWAMASAMIIQNIIKDKKSFKLTKLNRFVVNKNLFKNIYNSLIHFINFKKNRCTHLGCNLIYNKDEELYECPCHGSIYNKEGKVIKGPAIKDAKIKTNME